MKVSDGLTLARELVGVHLPYGWRVDLDRATRRAGACYYTERRIVISALFIEDANKQQLTDVILHEIAHGLVGIDHGHDEVWAQTALEIGGSARPTVRWERPEPIPMAAFWVSVMVGAWFAQPTLGAAVCGLILAIFGRFIYRRIAPVTQVYKLPQ